MEKLKIHRATAKLENIETTEKLDKKGVAHGKPRMGGSTVTSVGILVFDNVEELDFVGVHEVLSLVNKVQNKDILKIHLIGTKRKIVCAHNLVICPGGHFSNVNPKDYQILVVPGGRGIQKLMQSAGIIRKIQQFASSGVLLASVCTGAFLLGKAGVLSGKKATTHSRHLRELRVYCQAVRSRVIRDSNVVTAGGIACSLDLGLYLLQMLFGKRVAVKVARRLEYKT